MIIGGLSRQPTIAIGLGGEGGGGLLASEGVGGGGGGGLSVS